MTFEGFMKQSFVVKNYIKSVNIDYGSAIEKWVILLDYRSIEGFTVAFYLNAFKQIQMALL